MLSIEGCIEQLWALNPLWACPRTEADLKPVDLATLLAVFSYRSVACLNYMFGYVGPPPPSGVTQRIFWVGSLISHVLQ